MVTSPGLHMAYFPLEHMELISPRPVVNAGLKPTPNDGVMELSR